ncbi:MAG: FAD-dependent oxidoreductase, partial [Alphaproteobacteria bacterium]|nr:FAD-dependent oxidoreductase [Alphaproteobacteria bacterium]
MSQTYDVVVIGGGPGGYTAAIRAAQLGKSVAVIEKEKLGGVCLNWGCIPTKALLKASKFYTAMSHAGDFGFKVKGVDVDVKKLISRSRDVAGKLSGGVEYLMKKNKIDVIEGIAKFSSKNTLDVTGKKGKVSSVSFTNAIVATGAR